ncbi:MAG: phage holin family protein [Proteobacteria bacterium]|jgi:uncharacterized membrane protein YqjE|nr:phage holin family protein [Pseudomonadota bacterium]
MTGSAKGSSRPGVAATVAGTLADLVELGQIRLELFTIEAREDLNRLATMALLGALGLVLLSFGLIFLALFLTVLLWDSHRLLALGVFTALFLVGGGVTAAMAWARTRQGLRLFSATLNELRRDQERLRT